MKAARRHLMRKQEKSTTLLSQGKSANLAAYKQNSMTSSHEECKLMYVHSGDLQDSMSKLPRPMSNIKERQKFLTSTGRSLSTSPYGAARYSQTATTTVTNYGLKARVKE